MLVQPFLDEYELSQDESFLLKLRERFKDRVLKIYGLS
jgi:hypothetical protein